MAVLCPSCIANTMSSMKLAHLSREFKFKEELPACLAICIELGNREDDPTTGIQSLSLTVSSKHRDYMKTPVTFTQVTERYCQVRNPTLWCQ